MCGFTCIKYSECGHEILSTTPEHTCLCPYAIMVEPIQGVDHAPPPCVPTNDTDTLIAANHRLFDYCPLCRPGVDAEEPERIRRGDLEDILQPHAHQNEEEEGDYDEEEMTQLSNLRVYVEKKLKIGIEFAEELEVFLQANPEVLTHVTNNAFRYVLSQQGPEKYNGMLLDALRQCRDMLPILEMYVLRKVSNKLFVETFT